MTTGFDHYEYALNLDVTGPITPDVIASFSNTNDPDLSSNVIELNKVLIFYNPCAGNGKATSIIADILMPILHQKDISSIVYPTKSKGDLQKYLINHQDTILSYKINAFIVIGGDGTMHEFVNGYVGGKYKEKGIFVVLVNGGSGNSLCCALNGFSDNNDKLTKYLNHVFDIKQDKNAIQYIDCVEYIRNNKTVLYSASQSYFGIPSAVTGWAEWNVFRMIFGASSLRYDIGAFIEMSKHREYKLKFTFYGLQKQRNALNDDFDDNKQNNNNNSDDKAFELIKTVEMFVAMKGKYFGKEICVAPFAKLDNGYLDVLLLERVESRLRLITLFLKLQKIKQAMQIICEPEIYYYRCKELKVDILDNNNNIITDENKLKQMGYPGVDCDGEYGPLLPLRIKANRQAIPVLFPNPKLF